MQRPEPGIRAKKRENHLCVFEKKKGGEKPSAGVRRGGGAGGAFASEKMDCGNPTVGRGRRLLKALNESQGKKRWTGGARGDAIAALRKNREWPADAKDRRKEGGTTEKNSDDF